MSSADPRSPIRFARGLADGQRVELDAHQADALRLREIREKEAFTLVDSSGRFFRASLVSLAPKAATALVYESMPASTESPAEITLLCAVLARQRMLTVVQKATELGVARIVPVLSERSVPREGLAHEKAHAWPAQAIRACRQCRRASVPDVREATPLDEALRAAFVAEADVRIHLDDRTAALPATASSTSRDRTRIVFAVGPEGGFTDAERAAIDARGFAPMRLGGRVLRAETAVLVGLTILQQAYGDMDVSLGRP